MDTWQRKLSVMHRYNVTAQMYNMRYAREQETKFKAALSHIDLAGSVLDVGCGTGLMFSYAANLVEQIVAIDISIKQLHEAKKQVDSFDNIHLICADADYLPVKDNRFEAAFAFTVLQNMPKPERALRELIRVGKRGSSIVVTGLKKAFSFKSFKDLLKKESLNVVFCKNNTALKCYVAVGTKGS